MTNVIVRACAPGLPTPNEAPQAAAPSRRAFLAIASAAAVTSGSGAASAHIAASPAMRPHVDLPAEHPRLMEIGAQLNALLDRHAEADSALGDAEERALALCPAVPACLKPDLQHPEFRGSARLDLDPELDALGNHIGPVQTIRGRRYPIGTVASTSAIARVIENSQDRAAQAKRLKPLLAEAKAYEAQRAEAIAASGLPRAITDLNAAARAIWELAREAAGIPATSVDGIAIKARALEAAAKTWDEHGCSHGRLVAAEAADAFISSVARVLGHAG